MSETRESGSSRNGLPSAFIPILVKKRIAWLFLHGRYCNKPRSRRLTLIVLDRATQEEETDVTFAAERSRVGDVVLGQP